MERISALVTSLATNPGPTVFGVLLGGFAGWAIARQIQSDARQATLDARNASVEAAQSWRDVADSRAENIRKMNEDLEQARSREKSLEAQFERGSNAKMLVGMGANCSEILVNEIFILQLLYAQLSVILGYGMAGRPNVDPQEWLALRNDLRVAIDDHQDAQYKMQCWVGKAITGEIDPYSSPPQPEAHFRRLIAGGDRGVITTLEERVSEMLEEFDQIRNGESPAKRIANNRLDTDDS